MQELSRRNFFKTATAGTIAGAALLQKKAASKPLDKVKLGKTGIEVSYLAMGTGTNGGKYHSNQIRMGLKPFISMARHAYESGITFFETAEMYGTQRYLGPALQEIPRKDIVLMTKIWVSGSNWAKTLTVEQYLRQARREMKTDYVDIVLLHCMTSEDWPQEFETFCYGLSKAKQAGDIRAHGVSCHSLAALKTAASSDWVDILLSRVNHAGRHMDDKPEVVMPVLEHAHNRGAGVIGMKIFGQGDFETREERQKSLDYVCNSPNVDAMTIGFESEEQIDDAIGMIGTVRG
ncbi:aldo/keto reductase [candidate division KSB1 bacterium]|nr:aldo/keto reductase [candidate division KSB1 bacterium]